MVSNQSWYHGVKLKTQFNSHSSQTTLSARFRQYKIIEFECDECKCPQK